MAATNILMLVVLQQAGAEASAYYYMATLIGYTLYLIVSNVGSALVAESARYPARAVELARQALRNAARLVIPLAAVVGSLVAHLLLSVLGQSYADNATVLLRLILISAIPQLIVGISLSTARVRDDLRTIMIVYAAHRGRGPRRHLDRAAVRRPRRSRHRLLATETVVALGLLFSGRTGLWTDRRRRRPVAARWLGAARYALAWEPGKNSS